jgi:hypothetical protein
VAKRDGDRDVLLGKLNALDAEDRAWIAARLLEANDVDDQTDAYHFHYEALFDLVDAKVTPKPEKKARPAKLAVRKKDFYVFFTLHVRLRLNDMGTKNRAGQTFARMADVDAVRDGKILETEVDTIEPAP